MNALVLKAYRQFEYQETPTPTPGPDEVLLEVKACGICGSDVHGMDGSTGRRRPPIIMGHEAAGVVAEVGSGVQGWTVGDRVTLDSTIYCGHCNYCRAGLINLCEHRRVLGVSCEEYRQPGAFADFVTVPPRILYKLPDTLSFEQAALVEPFAIALHAIGRAAPKLNDTIVVVGAGMIGVALVQALSRTSCAHLVAIDLAEERLALARKLGATHTINSSLENPLDALKELTKGKGADVAFEAVGLTATVNLALACLRKGGAVTLVGNVTPQIDFPLQTVVTRELTVYGSCASRGEYPACLDMLARGALKAEPLITAAAPLSEGAQWFDRLYRKEPGLMKVILVP